MKCIPFPFFQPVTRIVTAFLSEEGGNAPNMIPGTVLIDK